MLRSIVRGAILASCVGLVVALLRSTDLPVALAVALIVAAHIALPVAAAFWPPRPDDLTFDSALAGLGLVYIGLLGLSPNATNWLYIGVPFSYALYAFVATALFAAAGRVRERARQRAVA